MEEKTVRAFHWTSNAWYTQRKQPGCREREVMFGLYARSGGCEGEIAMHWYEVGGEIVPRIEAFQDSWETLHGFRDVLSRLAWEDADISEEQFVAILRSCGFEDFTEYENPNPLKWLREPTLEELKQEVAALKAQLATRGST